MVKLKKDFLKLCIVCVDILFLYISLIAAIRIRYPDFTFQNYSNLSALLVHFSLLYFFWLAILFILDVYNVSLKKRFFDLLISIVLFAGISAGIGSAFFYFQPSLGIEPRTILLLHIVLFTGYLLLSRWLLYYFVTTRVKEKVIIIGYCPLLEKMNRYLSLFCDIVAIYSNDQTEAAQLFAQKHSAVFTVHFEEVKKNLESRGIESVIFAFKDSDELYTALISGLPLTLNYIRISSLYDTFTRKIPLDAIDLIWIFENISRHKRQLYLIIKRLFDFVFSLIGGILSLPIIVGAAVLIKLDSCGPVVYRQRRIGYNGREFELIKLRTMRIDAEKEGPTWAVKNDARATRVGKVLRALYIDELPQLYNIFMGQISFVGPRPERPEFVEKLKEALPFYGIRLLAQPGLTGWAQINYHAPVTLEETREKLAYDLYYIKNSSFFFDCAILLKTARALFIKYGD